METESHYDIYEWSDDGYFEPVGMDVGTLRLIQFDCMYPVYSTDIRCKQLLLLLYRLVPKEAVDVSYRTISTNDMTELCRISCWLTETELALVEELTGCTDGDDANEKMLSEAIDILKKEQAHDNE